MTAPRFSVLIPCHYSRNDIRLAVDSVAAQTYPNVEIVIMADDGDDYRPLVADVAGRMPVTFGSSGGKSTGRSNANNIGIRLCTGDMVLVLDSDDFIAPDFCEKTAPVVMKEGACLTPRLPVDYDDYSPVPTRGLRKLGAYSGKSRMTTHDYMHLPFGWQTVYRRDLLIHPWETQYWLDPDFILECSLFDRIGHAPYLHYQGYHYRIRPGSICHSKDSHELVIAEYRSMIARLEDDSDGLRLEAHTRKAMVELLEGRIGSVQRYLRDKEGGALLYEPLAIGDMLMYPLE